MKTEEQMGIFYTAFSYCLWGILPIYWKWLSNVSAGEILANRIFWSFWFMLFILFFTKRWKSLLSYLKGSLTKKKQIGALVVASMLISMNWFIYIWAVNSNQVVEASLGYYINPLVSVLLGVFILKESLSKAQVFSFILAAIGVAILTFSYGQFPWIAVGLALSFGLYGLAKKLIKVDSAIGLTLETMTIVPFALLYMIYLVMEQKQALFQLSIQTDILLIGAGAATAIPLLYFSKGAQQIPLYMVGFLQYIAPTLMLILGIFVYNERFSREHLVSFLFIWLALSVFTLSRVRVARQQRREKKISA